MPIKKTFPMRVNGQAERVETEYQTSFGVVIQDDLFTFVIHRWAVGSDWSVSEITSGARFGSLSHRLNRNGHLITAGRVLMEHVIAEHGEARVRSVLAGS